MPALPPVWWSTLFWKLYIGVHGEFMWNDGQVFFQNWFWGLVFICLTTLAVWRAELWLKLIPAIIVYSHYKALHYSNLSDITLHQIWGLRNKPLLSVWEENLCNSQNWHHRNFKKVLCERISLSRFHMSPAIMKDLNIYTLWKLVTNTSLKYLKKFYYP